jgi:hypothetical protein
MKVGIIGSQFAADLHAEGSTFGNSGPEQSQYASSHQLRHMSARQFRAEGLNIFNQTQWSTTNNYVGYAEFPLLRPGAHAAGAEVCTSNYILMVSSVKLIWRGKELARNVS